MGIMCVNLSLVSEKLSEYLPDKFLSTDRWTGQTDGHTDKFQGPKSVLAFATIN